MNNKAFYEHGPVGYLHQAAKVAGIDTGSDTCAVLQQLRLMNIPHARLLEVGAGEGRAAKAMLANGFDGDLYLLEPVERYCELLRDRFSHEPNVYTQQGDVLCADLPYVDVSIWLFSGISELQPATWTRAVRRLLNVTAGVVVLDAPVLGQESIAEVTDGVYTVKEKWGVWQGRPLTPTAAEAMAVELDCHLRTIQYATSNSRQRLLYFFAPIREH